MSRLKFAPKIDDIKIIDIKRGLGEFVPKPEEMASFAGLRETLKKAGYTLSSAEIAVSGTLVRDGDKWLVEASQSKQRFLLEGAELARYLPGMDSGSAVEVMGEWQTEGKDATNREVVQLSSAKKLAVAFKSPDNFPDSNRVPVTNYS